MIITQEIHKFREAARHLWNTCLKDGATWDTVDTFNDVCKLLFEEIILSRQNVEASIIPLNEGDSPIQEYQIYRDDAGKLPLQVNRDLPPSGYWDYPLDWIPPEDPNDIRPISFYDFDTIGWRNLEYYRVRILKCPSHPEIEGRDALVRCDHVEIKLEEAEPTSAADG